jgi:hypothetical protein
MRVVLEQSPTVLLVQKSIILVDSVHCGQVVYIKIA